MALPALQGLAELTRHWRPAPGAHPGTDGLRITVLGKAHLLPLFARLPVTCLPLPEYRSLSDLPEVAQRLSRLLLDGALLLTPSMRAMLEVTLAGVPVRVGYPDDVRGLLLTHKVARPAPLLPQAHVPFARHGVEEALAAAQVLLQALGIPHVLDAPSPPQLSLPEAARARAQQLLGPAVEGPVLEGPMGAWVGLHPRSHGGLTRTWPLDGWLSLARGLMQHGLRVAIHGGPEPDAELEQALRALQQYGGEARVRGLFGPASLPLLELAACSQREAAFVTNDTGPMHLAAAAGARVVAVFGSTDPRLTGPYLGPGPACSSARLDVVRLDDLSCRGCYRRVCPYGLECLHGIHPEEVLARTLSMVKKDD